MHDDGRRPIAVSQTSDSSNLKREKSHFWEFISIAMMLVLKKIFKFDETYSSE